MRLSKKYGVLSMVDGAHSIGQHKVNVAKVDCDFFVSVSTAILVEPPQLMSRIVISG